MENLSDLRTEIAAIDPIRRGGRVSAVSRGILEVAGLDRIAALGNRVEIEPGRGAPIGGEVIGLSPGCVTVLPDAGIDGLAIGDAVLLAADSGIAPHDGWIGRIVDPFGRPLDGRPLYRGAVPRPLRAHAPAAATRGR
ncbi:MAG: flagellum-specific ATP synthase FliI, partial [Gemmobacter sp.]